MLAAAPKRAKFPPSAHLKIASYLPFYFINLSARFTVLKDIVDSLAPSGRILMGAVMMFAARADAERSGAKSLPPWRAARKSRLRLPASAIVLGYIALTAAFAVILGVALATFTTTSTNTQTLAPALSGAGTDIVTINTATTGTSGNTGGAGQITGDEGMNSRLIHNLGARSAITSAVGRF